MRKNYLFLKPDHPFRILSVLFLGRRQKVKVNHLWKLPCYFLQTLFAFIFGSNVREASNWCFLVNEPLHSPFFPGANQVFSISIWIMNLVAWPVSALATHLSAFHPSSSPLTSSLPTLKGPYLNTYVIMIILQMRCSFSKNSQCSLPLYNLPPHFRP